MENKTEAENLTLQQKTKELHVRYLERMQTKTYGRRNYNTKIHVL